jgi:hypothetical protein
MPDPVISSIATAVVGKAAELAVQGGRDACAALIRLVRDRLSHDKAAQAALERAQQSPRDEIALENLTLALERVAGTDAVFATQLRELWPRAAAELSASEGGVVNQSTGSVGGHLMQARDVRVEGGLHFGDVDRPKEP